MPSKPRIHVQSVVFALALGLALPGCKNNSAQSAEFFNSPSGPPTGPQDPGWPRVFEKKGDQVTLYQPQVDSWKNYSEIAFRMAVGVKPKNREQTYYGCLIINGDTFINYDSRTVLINNLQP